MKVTHLSSIFTPYKELKPFPFTFSLDAKNQK